MSYIIRKTNGTTLGTILDGTVDTAHTSLTLVGRNYANYGQIMTDNLVKLVENFAYDIEPTNPLSGQLWWDTTAKLLKVYTGTYFKIISSATAQNSDTVGAPSTVVSGDIWWDTFAEQLYVYDGTDPYTATGWKLVGPVWSKENGKGGAIWEQIIDISAVTHNVVSLYIDGTRTAIINQDTAFTPLVAIAGFTTIKTGHNIHSSETFWGTANNASYLGDVIATNYLRTDINNSSTGNLHIVNDAGLTLGAGLDLTLAVTGINATITNNSTNGDISLVTNGTQYLTISGTSGVVEVNAAPTTTLGVATKGYVDDSFATSPVLGGVPTANTAIAGTNTTQVASTAFVHEANVGLKGYVDTLAGTIDSDISFKANIASPILTGNPQSVTPAAGDNDTSIATTAFVYEANVSLKAYVDAADTLKANLDSPTFIGMPLAPTMPATTANTSIATTAFVVNNSGFLQNKIYQGNSYLEILDAGTGSANLAIDGTSVMTASASGLNLMSGAVAVTQPQTYTSTGNAAIATTQFVRTAGQWWGGSAKFVSTSAPNLGVNDTGSHDGDFWFQYTA